MVPRHLLYGHVEVDAGNGLQSLVKDREKTPVTESLEVDEAERVYRGKLSTKQSFGEFGKTMHEMQQQHYSEGKGNKKPKPLAVICFKKIFPEEQMDRLSEYYKSAAKNPPNYCAKSTPGTHNCVTFAFEALQRLNFIPKKLRLSDFGQDFLPNTFLQAMESLVARGFFESRQVYTLADDGSWSLAGRD